MKEIVPELDFDSIRAYMRNTSVFFDGIESGFLERASKKSLAVLSQLLKSRCRPVISERIIEYSLLFQYMPSHPQEILEFGCAEGISPIQLCAIGHSVTGLDFRPYPFTHKNFRFIQADILDWEALAENFDIAISISTVEHVGLGYYGDPALSNGDKIAVDKLKESLKPGGHLVLTVPAGKACVRRGMRIYDSKAIERLVSDIEQIRFFWKRGRFSDWEETTAKEIENLTYEDYESRAPVQGVAFIVAKKK